MNTFSKSILACLALFLLATLGAGCGGSDTAGEAGGEPAATAAPDTSAAAAPDAPAADAGPGEEPPAGAGTAGTADAAAASFEKAFKEMAAAEGIYFGEVPEGFPLDFLPLYPDGQIDKSSVQEGDFTLLQLVPADRDTVFAFYKKHFDGLGWSAGDPFTMGNRTLVGFVGSDAKVDMTMMDREEGKTFVSMVLSRD